MKTGLTIILLLTIHITNFGQVTNSWSSNRTGMYYSTIDTLIQIINKDGKLDQLLIPDDELRNHEDLPDKIHGLRITRIDDRFKSKNQTEKDLRIFDLDLQVNKDIVYVQTIMLTTKQTYGYSVIYKYQPTTGTFTLDSINEISVNVHLYK